MILLEKPTFSQWPLIYYQAGCDHYRGEAIFTASFNTCYFSDITLIKVKGGGINDNNYKCEESGECYRVMKFEKLQ